MQQTRVILYHQQPTSARTRFLRFSNDSVCAFEPLPKLASLIESPHHAVAIHPTAILNEIENRLELTRDSLEAEEEYQALVDVPNGPVHVLLARFTSEDPPFALADRLGARFIDFIDAIDLPQVELELLRMAYEQVVGG